MADVVSSPYSHNLKHFEKEKTDKTAQVLSCFMTQAECEKTRNTCTQLLESKIKISLLGLKLWIVTSVVTFLLTLGGGVVCVSRTTGTIEEKVSGLEKGRAADATQIESLRRELWQVLKIGPYRDLQNTQSNQQDAIEPSAQTLTGDADGKI